MSPACRTPNGAIPPIRPRQPPPRPPPATANPATPGRLPAQPPLSGPPNGGFCTIRRIATACRRRVAPLMLQFPPFARSNHGPARRQRRSAGPHPVACLPSHRSPGHTPPPNGGFCTIRRIATACRRRVAPLMLQFPPHTTPATAPPASDGQSGHGLGPASRPPPPAETSCTTSYSDKTKSNQLSSLKLSQTNV